MQIASSAFGNNQYIPSVYTCDGINVNPPLSWSGSPRATKSFALIVDDPDAPHGEFVHWLVWNIAPDTSKIDEHSIPRGAMEGMTDFSKSGYGGPCPPSGVHRYQFKLYALEADLNLPRESKRSDLESAMRGHILDEDQLIGLYRR